jgi:cell division protein FtsZ
MLEIVDSLPSSARLKVFGVGGGGSNAVNRMIQAGLNGVDFWVANTDLQALEQATCPNRLQIGRAVTRGLGAGGDPEIGRLSGEEDRETIAEVLRGTDMLFITAGMGGGTGTGAAPVVAEVARELGILTVAIVTKPFSFEGKKKMARAEVGMSELSAHVDTLIAIPNQKLLNIVAPGTPFRAAMLVADEVLFQATRGISDLITGHGEINLDFADVKSVMKNRGNALLGCGVASGKARAVEAAQAAVSSPLLEEVSILGAEALLINVQGGPNMTLHEAAEAAQFISERVGEETDVFWGSVVDSSLDEEMRVTLIATGFPRTAAPRVDSSPRRGESDSIVEKLLEKPAERSVPAEPAVLMEAAAEHPAEKPSGRSPLERPAESTVPIEKVVTERVRPELKVVEGRSERAAERHCEPQAPKPPAIDYASTWSSTDMETLSGHRSTPKNAAVPQEEAVRNLLRPGWVPEQEDETPLFLPVEAPEHPARERASVAGPARRCGPVEPAETSRTRMRRPVLLRNETNLESRLGRRSPLDEPAFMRKRMD